MRIEKIWDRLCGSRDQFSLQNRILNAGSLLSAFALFLFVIYNLTVIILPSLAIATGIALVVQLYLYYLSRVRHRFAISRIGFTIGNYIFLSMNYYYSAGINGPTLFGFVVTLIIVLVINSRGQLLLLLTHCLIGIALLSFEYRFGVMQIYPNDVERYLDVGSTYVIMLSLTFLLVRGVVNGYKEERLLASRRAEELAFLHNENARLFSIISHDLRSPLNSIQGYLELLSGQSITEQEKAQVELDLLDHTKSTSEMLSNLLFWSKSQMEGMKVQLRLLSLTDIVNDVVNTLQPVAQKKDIRVETGLSANQVYADSEMLRIVLRNLLSNAVKFTESGGNIIIRSRQAGADCVISIEDHGVGIADDKRPLIFTTQVKSSLGTGNEPGIGLGLMLCFDFVKLQGGKIWFESENGSGTTFFISLPVSARA